MLQQLKKSRIFLPPQRSERNNTIKKMNAPVNYKWVKKSLSTPLLDTYKAWHGHIDLDDNEGYRLGKAMTNTVKMIGLEAYGTGYCGNAATYVERKAAARKLLAHMLRNFRNWQNSRGFGLKWKNVAAKNLLRAAKQLSH